MNSKNALAIAAVAILASCGDKSGAGSGEAIPQHRADALSSDGMIVYQEYSNWSYCPCDYSTGGACDAVCYDYYFSNLRMASSDGTDAGPVPAGNYGATPAWSPDNAQVAFVSGIDSDIHVADLATGTVRNLTNHRVGYWFPTWSPDGGQIAFGSLAPGSSYICCGCASGIGCIGGAIYVMNATDGSGVRVVTSSAGVFPYGRIDWSPRGSTLAFDCAVQTNSDVCTINVDGTGFTQLTSNAGTNRDAAWSPDGTRIAFSTSRYGTGDEIAVMNADGTNVSRLGAGVTGHHPTWSPDGSRIAFVDVDASCPSSSCIYTVQADGTGRTLILSSASGGDSGVTTPAWTRSSTAPPTPPPDQPPVASFTSSCSGLACTFDSRGSTDDHGIASRYWFLGDGETSTDAVALHSYAVSGTYNVTLTVTDYDGQSATTTQAVTVPPPVDQPPAAPSGLVAAPSAATTNTPTVTLIWMDNAFDETAFEIQRASDASFSVDVATFTVGPDVTSYVDASVAPNAAYAYRIRAVNLAGASAWSNVATATTPGIIPAAPSGLVATPGKVSVALAWTDNSTNETGFSIERSADGTSFGVIATVPSNTTAYQDVGLRHRRTYWYRVRATGAAGPSAYSNTVSIVTL